MSPTSDAGRRRARAIFDASSVAQRSAEFDSERGSERRFGHTRVRRRMRRCIAAHDFDNDAGLSRPAEAQETQGDARRNIGRRIIKAGRCGAESAIARRSMPDHRIHGVDRSMCTRATRAERRSPQRRSDDGVDGVLCSDSMTAAAIADSSSIDGSRPTSAGNASRAPSISPASSNCEMSRAVPRSILPDAATATAAAVERSA
jgi:hypothetical protein